MYNSRILKSSNISVLDPVYIEVSVAEEEVFIMEEGNKTTDSEEIIDPEKTAEDIIKKAKEEAVAILEDYQLQLEDMKRKQQEEIDQYRETVMQDAYDKGYSKGYQEGKQAFEAALEGVHIMSNELQEKYKQLLEKSEPQIIELVLSITKKVVDDDIKFNKENMLSILKQALDICYKEQRATIKLSGKDFSYIKSVAPEMLSMINENENITLKEDFLLKEGDCLVETSYGTVDLSIDKRFERINEEFSDIINL